jgi:hypothetical protein
VPQEHVEQAGPDLGELGQLREHLVRDEVDPARSRLEGDQALGPHGRGP